MFCDAYLNSLKEVLKCIYDKYDDIYECLNQKVKENTVNKLFFRDLLKCYAYTNQV